MSEALALPAAHALTLQFLAWIAEAPRRRSDVMDAWQSSCPRLSIWEDALADGLVSFGRGVVTLTDAGRATLASRHRDS